MGNSNGSNEALSSFLASTVPMGTESFKTLKILRRRYPKATLPVDERDHHSFMTAMQLLPSRKSYQELHTLADFFTEQTVGKRRGKHKEQLRRHWEVVVLNLSRAALCHHWLYISLKKNSYTTEYWLKKYGFSYSCMKTIFDYLVENDLVEARMGAQYSKGAMLTRVHPKEQLKEHLWQFFLDAEEPIEPPYLRINKADGSWGDVIQQLPSDHTELVEMTRINEFLKGHSWACKGPVRMIYNGDIMGGGRLSTPFQNIPCRRYSLRLCTKIDGQDICEVDFSANHLRLYMALIEEEDAGEDPYEAICANGGWEASYRSSVKWFITVAMGAGSHTLLQGAPGARDSAKSACYRYGISSEQFDAIEAATLATFPKLGLYKGFGLHAQAFEGQILKDVMLQGVEKGIVCLPVHDAIAVQVAHKDWAVAAMTETWARHVHGKARTRVKVST
jgi:hypothetical protein